MSRHEGVSCDSCLKSNFRGRRYKCLICFDYDLCAICYEEGATSTRHSADHPMQCILTRTDFDLFYGGETYGTDQPQSFTCPYCKRMGFSDATLIDHVSAEHIDTGLEVVCPVCASVPGGEPNLITEDFAGHLSLEHRAQARGDLISFLHAHDEPGSIRHGGVRRIPHSGGSGGGGRALGGPRSRRSNMHFSSAGTLSALSPASRDAVDPISELLSQLTGATRRGAPQPSQLAQLQMQIQLERQQQSARQNLERVPRRQAHPIASTSSASVVGGVGPTMAAVVAGNAIAQAQLQQHQNQQQQLAIASGSGLSGREITITSNPMQMAMAAAAAAASTSAAGAAASGAQSMFLLNRIMTSTLPDAERTEMERNRADRSQYVQGLLLSTMSQLHLGNLDEEEAAAAAALKPTESEQATEAELRRLADQNDAANEEQQLQQQLNCDQHENVPPQHYGGHYGRGGGLLDDAAAAKLKSAAAAAGGKPPMQGGQRPAGRQQQQQQQQQQPASQKAREMKAAAKESHDASR